jgi:hypothetical protein
VVNGNSSIPDESKVSSIHFDNQPIAKSTVRSPLLEDADYDGRSLSMLQKIGGALNQTVEIKFSVIAS